MPQAADPSPHPVVAMRLFVGGALQLAPGLQADLPEQAVRHAQVRRVQPGDWLCLFDGEGADWPALVLDVGRKHVRVELGMPRPVALELHPAVTLAVVVPANERMDSLVEKATELGVACIQPLMSVRSVLRLSGERAQRRVLHWQAVAVAASEQCGRARVPSVAPVQALLPWLQGLTVQPATLPGGSARAPANTPAITPTNATASATADAQPVRWLLSLHPQAQPLAMLGSGPLTQVLSLSGPEGGFAPDEAASARAVGFCCVSLGPRVLRADTAPLALLAWLALRAQPLSA